MRIQKGLTIFARGIIMIIGALVWLNSKLYYEHDENMGIVIRISNKKIPNNIGQLEHIVDVLWNTGKTNTYYVHELEKV